MRIDDPLNVSVWIDGRGFDDIPGEIVKCGRVRVRADYEEVGSGVVVLEDVSSGDSVKVYSVGGVAQGLDVVADSAHQMVGGASRSCLWLGEVSCVKEEGEEQ